MNHRVSVAKVRWILQHAKMELRWARCVCIVFLLAFVFSLVWDVASTVCAALFDWSSGAVMQLSEAV